MPRDGEQRSKQGTHVDGCRRIQCEITEQNLVVQDAQDNLQGSQEELQLQLARMQHAGGARAAPDA